MTAAVAVANLLLGIAYTGYGVMTVIEMRRDWPSFGFSHFGTAWICMAFTCGPHHLVHAVHLAAEGRPGGPLDLVAVIVGLPVGVLWLSLRVEAFAGGQGDRFVFSTPWWLRVAPVASGLYLVAVGFASVAVAGGQFRPTAIVRVNAALVVLYMAIGWVVLRTQLRNHALMGGWSVSGLCLAVIFPTCALMHGVWAAYALGGLYHHDVHGLVVDWLSVPAAVYFLWVVHRLYRDSLRDWNQGPGEVGLPVLTPPMS